MSEEYKDYLALAILIGFFGTIVIVMIWAAGWFFPIVLGIIGIMGLITWALDRVADF